MFTKIKQFGTAAVILALSGVCYAIGPGWYVGLGAGSTNVHAKTYTFTVPSGVPPTLDVSPSTNGIGERMFFGYHINPYAGMEFGFSHYGNATYKIPNGYDISCSDPSIRQNGFDMEGVASLPLVKSGFSFFAKLGMAVMYAGSSGALESNGANAGPCGAGTSSKAAARPLYGVGVGYDLNQNWVSDISFTRVNGGGNIQTADMIAVSFSYHFTDSYCGQFLC